MSSTNRKRILLVVRYPVGGIRTYIKYIYGQAIFDVFDFTLITPEQGLEPFFESIFSERNLEYVICKDNLDMCRVLWKYVRKNNVSLIHSHGFTAGILSVPIAQILGVSHLMTAHDVFQKKQFTGVRGWLKKWLLARLFSRIDIIHTVSHDATENLCNFFPAIQQEHIKCIPHGVDAERFYSATPVNLDLTVNRDNVCMIGFFGRFMAQKGFHYLVDAIEIIVREGMVEKTLLVLTFDWGGFVREEYQTIESRGLKQYFHMMKFTENMPGMIKAMDIVVMPSLWESSGLLGMEALVSGVPIIGSSCIGLREVLSDSPAIMVQPKDAGPLAIAIANEINAPSKSVFEEFAQTARQRFSLQRPSVELENIYHEMMAD